MTSSCRSCCASVKELGTKNVLSTLEDSDTLQALSQHLQYVGCEAAKSDHFSIEEGCEMAQCITRITAHIYRSKEKLYESCQTRTTDKIHSLRPHIIIEYDNRTAATLLSACLKSPSLQSEGASSSDLTGDWGQTAADLLTNERHFHRNKYKFGCILDIGAQDAAFLNSFADKRFGDTVRVIMDMKVLVQKGRMKYHFDKNFHEEVQNGFSST